MINSDEVLYTMDTLCYEYYYYNKFVYLIHLQVFVNKLKTNKNIVSFTWISHAWRKST